MANVEIPDQPAGTHFRVSRGILLTQALRLTVRVVTAAGLARLVSPADYGVFGMAALVHGLAYVVQDFGLASVTLRQREMKPGELTALFWLNAGVGAAFTLLIAALGPVAAAFYGEPRLRLLLPVMAMTLLINGCYAQLRAQLGREHRFNELNLIEITAFVASSGAALLAAWLGAGCWALAVMPLTAEAVLALGVWRAQSWRPQPWPAGYSPRSALVFGAGISGHEILRYLMRSTDQFLVGRWFGSSALGLYGRGVQLVILPGQYLTDPLAAWVISSLGRSAGEPAAIRAFWCRVVNGLAHLTLPLAVVLFCLPREILHIAFGPGWVAGAGMLRGLSLGLIAQPVLTAETWLLIASGHGRRLLSLSGSTLAAVLVACWLARSYGPAGIAGAFGSALVLVTFGGAFLALRDLPAGPRDLAGAIARPLLIATIAGAVTSGALSSLPAWSPLARVVLGTAIVAGTWAGACAWPATRVELTGHFLRHRA